MTIVHISEGAKQAFEAAAYYQELIRDRVEHNIEKLNYEEHRIAVANTPFGKLFPVGIWLPKGTSEVTDMQELATDVYLVWERLSKIGATRSGDEVKQILASIKRDFENLCLMGVMFEHRDKLVDGTVQCVAVFDGSGLVAYNGLGVFLMRIEYRLYGYAIENVGSELFEL